MPACFDCFAHVPFVRFGADDQVELESGELGGLSFERWLTLEDPSFAFQENRYLHVAPVFFQRRFLSR